ncbi:hypothetical protein D5S17_16645 [Pseudonocardiaceae bacterium YIM PH 21723]|nr:hypothetical protein D5S17_16645 [Pseudonocardiaceae bacterium YIM PH 21723]
MPSPSATMVVWASTWLHGAAAADDVLDALLPWAELHEVIAADDGTATELDLPGPDTIPTTLAMLLAALRRCGARSGRLVLPAPGDVRGLGGASPFSAAARRSGEAVVLADGGVGLVPEHIAEGIVRWTVFTLPDMPPAEYVPLGEAEFGLGEALRDSTAALTELDVARHRNGVREEITAWLKAQPQLDWPAHMPPRSLRVLQRATEVQAILEAAAGDALGGALSATSATARSDALRPLLAAVRTARCAAVAEAVRVLADKAGHH